MDKFEAELPDRCKVAPRVTPADIEAAIVSERYFTAADGCLGEWQYRHDTTGGAATPMEPVSPSLHLLTFCVLVLRNGFTVTGESACASPENFDPEVGRKVARQAAIAKVWPLLGYALRDRLAAAQ